jgi:hypothetical protein
MNPTTHIVALASLGGALASEAMLHGFKPSTPIGAHAAIDLDQKDMEDALGIKAADATTPAPNYADAIAAFTVGGNSLKGSGATRTLKGFSTGLHAKAGPAAADEAMYILYNDYYNRKPIKASVGAAADPSVESKYGYKIVMAALEGNAADVGGHGNPYASVEDGGRIEVAKKTSVYVVAWMYVIHELEDAVNDCLLGNVLNNDLNPSGEAVAAWDEGWAFYAGSLGSKMSYALAEKRCENYGTCSGSNPRHNAANPSGNGGIAAVNLELLKLYNRGADLLVIGQCDAVANVVKEMEIQMTIPNLQGMLRYAYKEGHNGYRNRGATEAAASSKQSGEGWAFALAVLPQLDQCDAAAAARIRAHMDLDGVAVMDIATTPLDASFIEIYEDVVSMLPCLGITCDQLGGLRDSDTTYYADFGKCTDVGGTPKILGSAAYTFCGAGTQKHTHDGVTECEACPAGTASSELGAGYGSILDANPCKECSGGYFSAAGSATCTICPVNTYSLAGAAECTRCGSGETTYAGTKETKAGGATACVNKKKNSDDGMMGLIIGLVIAAIMAMLAACAGGYAMSLKSNYETLVAEKSKGAFGARV